MNKNCIYEPVETVEMTNVELLEVNGGKNVFEWITEAIGFMIGEFNDGHFCGTYGARVYEEE